MNTVAFLVSVGGEDCRPCDWALVVLDALALRHIAKRRAFFEEAKRHDDAIYEVYYWDGMAITFLSKQESSDDYGGDPLTEKEEAAEAALDALRCKSEEVVQELVNPETLEGHREAVVDCVQMVIHEIGVRWMCYAKHEDGEIRTATIPWSRIQKENS